MCMGMTYVVIWLVKYLRPTPRSKRGYVRVDKAQICCGLDIGQEGLSSVYTGVVPVSSRVQKFPLIITLQEFLTQNTFVCRLFVQALLARN